MKTRNLILALLITLVVAQIPPIRAQGQDHLSLVKPLNLWIGEWKGSGWSVNEFGQRIEFDLTESVLEKAGGTVLLVEGRGVRSDRGGRGKLTHDGLVLVYRDASGRYRWNGHEARSGLSDVELSIVENGVQWSMSPGTKGAVVRFTILLDATRWREFGEVSADGVTWNRFMEMTLSRSAKRK
jgi:hypothetical protein